ncbi:MAG: hypothetical protein ACUVUQ_06750, partial [Thermodesulfovibrionales bacterium]
MSKKKIIFWFAGIIVILIIGFLAFSLYLQRFINIESVKEKIVESLSKTSGGKIYIQNTEISFSPRPCLKIYQVRISIQEKAEGRIKLLKIYPEIFPLIRSEVRISKIYAEYPDFFIKVPVRKEKISLIDIEKKLITIINLLEENAPKIDISIKRGRLNLNQNQKTNLLFQDIYAKIGFPPWGLRYTINACLDNSNSIAISGRLDTKDFKGNGSIYLKNFGIHKFMNFFLLDDVNHVKDSIVNLKVSFQTEGMGTLHADIEGSVPHFVLQRMNQEVNTKVRETKIVFEINNEKMLLSINKLDIDEPKITMTGSLHINKIAPNIYLFLKGTDIDVNELRNKALSLASDIPIVKDVSKYVRGGRVPIITFYTRGGSIDDLGRTENIIIKGRMLQGNIFIPGPDLAFKSVEGDCIISSGILNVSQLSVQLKNALLRRGFLRIGLKGEDAAFHLDTLAKVDLAGLLSLLKHIVKNESLLKEFDLISEIKGDANGRVILGETIDSIQVEFDVFDTKLYSRYKRIPYPVEVKEGRFFYNSSKIVVKNANFILGKSSFDRFNGFLQLKEPYNFEIVSGKSSLNLEELYKWSSTYKQLKGLFDNIILLQGATFLEFLNIKGPLLSPERWAFQFVGELRNIKINSSLFPKPFSVTTERFELTTQRISLSRALINTDDTSLTVSGFLKTDLKSIKKADISINGTAGSSLIQCLKVDLNLPSEVRVPHSILLTDSHLIREETGDLSFKGVMKIKDGPEVIIDVYKTPEELSIKKFSLKDITSDARLSFKKQNKKIDFTFSGLISRKTVDTLVTLPEFSGGLIKGDLRAEIQTGKILRINTDGKIYGEKIAIPWKSNTPIKIGKLFLDASAKDAKFETDLLTWGNTTLSLKGSLDSWKEGTIINMDVSAEKLDWNNVKKLFDKDQKEDKKTDEIWKQSIRVIAKIKAKDAIFGRFSVSPLNVNLSLAEGVLDTTITKADICFIPVSGKVKISNNNIETNLKFSSNNQTFEPFITCIGNKGLITGKFDLQGEISSCSRHDEVAQSLKGNLIFKAKDGRIY